jgi:hypothetical protein
MKKYLLAVLGLCVLICSASFASNVQAIDNDAWLDHVTRMQIIRENMLKLVSKEMPTAEDKAKLAEMRQSFAAHQYDWDAYLKNVANSTGVTPKVGLPGCQDTKCSETKACNEAKAPKCNESKCGDKKSCCKSKMGRKHRNYNPKYGFCRKCGEVRKNCECKKETAKCGDSKCADKKECCKSKAKKCGDSKCADKKECCKSKAKKCGDSKCADKKERCKSKAKKCGDSKCADKKECCKSKAKKCGDSKCADKKEACKSRAAKCGDSKCADKKEACKSKMAKKHRNYNPKYGFCRKCGEVKKNCECKKEAMRACKLCGNDYKNCICKKTMNKCSTDKACCKAKTSKKVKNYNPEYGFCRTCGEVKKNCECK